MLDQAIKIETSQTLDSMLHQVLNQALVAIEAEAGSLMLVNHKQGILQIKARLGKPQPGRKTERVYRVEGQSIASWVVQNKQSYLCHDVNEDTFYLPARIGQSFRSLLSVPIIYEGRVLAVLNTDDIQPHKFTEQHRKRLEVVAQQVAGPIAERISILDAFNEIGVEITRLLVGGRVEAILKRLADLAIRSLGADMVTLYPYIQNRREFPVENTGPIISGNIYSDPSVMRREVFPGDVPWTVVHKRQSGFYADIQNEEFLTQIVNRPNTVPRPRFVEREGIKSMAALLLPHRAAEDPNEEVVGVIFANYRTRHEFSIDEIAALATFADYAAAAILNTRLEEQRREEELKREEQRQTEEIKLLESISANFAHRMNNLAATSRAAVQILRVRNSAMDDVSLRQLDRITGESDLLLELAGKLSRPLEQELNSINIIDVLGETLAGIRLNLDHDIIRAEAYSDLPEVRSVEFQLRQVIRDIINNALEATKNQTDAIIIVRTRLNRDTDRVEIEISDNGPGIRDDIREKLFSPGNTTKKDSLGIGLWWCRVFMRATGGDVTLKDTLPGQPTTFVIEIPSINSGDSISAGKPLTIRSEKDILIVDDVSKWRDQLVDILVDEAYRIEEAPSYAQASYALETNNFKLAILDISLVDDPDNEDGLRLLADIDQMRLQTKVIIVTGYGTSEREKISKQSPRVIDFIRKEKFDTQAFRETVRKICG